MEDSLGSTIEKIKQQEQNKEAKLKEKREIDTFVISLRREIRECYSQAEIYQQMQDTLFKNIATLRTQVILEKIRRESLTTQLHVLNKELEDLRVKSIEGISKVWEQRSSLCEKIHTTTENYDVWALLIKPTCLELSYLNKSFVKQEENNLMLDNEIRLQEAVAKRDMALKERDRLKAEPDNGEEFLRIKNALRYSLEKIDQLTK
ncbi:uncharacterized protein LOC124529838 [Vanessa cardui]|uniref:uncharacterized protein LOC124529838 n=1 Tax=Vanessa cardui TaxID=171605 RepID=UPI001F133D0E|nr:uncharacterized protein LOC124529838 [Vanessa cardui]